MLTGDGRCKTLDAAADGYVRAEACVAVLLTLQSPFSDDPSAAQRRSSGDSGSTGSSGGSSDGAVLQATYVNQDGRSSSLTAPNGPSQQQARCTSAPCLYGSHLSAQALELSCCFCVTENWH